MIELTSLRTPTRWWQHSQRRNLEVPIPINPRPHLPRQLTLILLNHIPKLIIRRLDIPINRVITTESRYRRGSLLPFMPTATRDGRVGVGGDLAAAELELKTLGHHGEWPGPNDGAVVRACCPVLRVHGCTAECWVRDEHAGRGHQACWEGAADVGGGVVEVGGELGVVCGVEEEVAEAIVRVHDFYLGKVVVAVQGEGVEDNVRGDGGGLVGACERGGIFVGGD